MEVSAGNCTASEFGGRAISGWSGFLSPGASVSALVGGLGLDNRECLAQGNGSAGKLDLSKQGSVVLT